MLSMKEACRYLKESRHKRNQEHRLKVLEQHGELGFITGFTDKEYKKVKVKQKNAFGKSKKASFNSIWRYYDLPRIQ